MSDKPCDCGTCEAIRADRELRTAAVADQCRPVEINGQIVRVHGEREMNDKDREMLAEVIAAARRYLDGEA